MRVMNTLLCVADADRVFVSDVHACRNTDACMNAPALISYKKKLYEYIPVCMSGLLGVPYLEAGFVQALG